MIHRSTYPNPSPNTQSHTHTHKHKPSNHQQSHTHTNHQTSWSQQRPPHPPPKPPISKPKPSIRNPRRKFETQTTDQKNHHRSKPIQKKSSPEPPNQTHSKKIITKATIEATDDQPNRFTHQSTDPPFQTHQSTGPNPPSTDSNPPIQTQLADPR